MSLKRILFFLLFPLSLVAQDIKPDLTRDWSTQASARSHEILTAGTIIEVDGIYAEGSLNKNIKEGINYYIIYENNGAKELIYTSELVMPKRMSPEQSLSFDIAATQISLLKKICNVTGRKESDVHVYAAGRIIITNGKVSSIDNYSPVFRGGRDQEHLDFSIDILKKVGLELEANTNIVSYTKEQYGQDRSLNRCSSSLSMLKDPKAKEYLTKVEDLYSELAEKYPDKKVPGFVDIEELSTLGFDKLSEFFALAQDDGSSLAVVASKYYQDVTELDAILGDGKKVFTKDVTVNDKDRKEVVKDIFDKAVKTYGETPLAVMNILSDKDIIPENGTVIVLGPGKDFYEWIVPILNRSDVKVIVSEAPGQSMESKLYFDNMLYGYIVKKPDAVIPMLAERLWEEIQNNNPELIENGIIKSKEALSEAVKEQVKFVDAYNSTGDNIKNIEADVIISRLPYYYDLYGTLKKDGFAWVVTERVLDIDNPKPDLFNNDDPTTFKTTGYDLIKLPDNKVNTLLGSNENAASMQGRFRAFDLGGDERPFLLFPTSNAVKNDAPKSKYDDLYLIRNYKVKNIKGTYSSAGDIFSEDDGTIELPELPYGGKVLYLIYEDSNGKLKMAYSNEVPNLDVDLGDPKAEILVTHRSLYKKILSTESIIKGVVAAGEIVLMPNGEISLVTNRSNTFRGKQNNLDFAVKFFKDHGLVISDNTIQTDYDLGMPAKDHATSLQSAKALIRIVKDPAAFSYYKSVIDTQKELASIMKSTVRPGGALDPEKVEARVFTSKVVGFLSEIESLLANGEGIATNVETWLKGSGESLPYAEQLKEIQDYISDHKESKTGPIIATIIVGNGTDPDREEKEYYPNSTQLKSIKQYKDNELTCEETFFKSGRQESRAVYKGGVKQGAYQKNYDKDALVGKNASVVYENGFYDKGKRTGAYYFYYDTGKKEYVFYYDPMTGALKTITEYDETGSRKIKSSVYDNDVKVIEASNYYPSGQIKKKAKFVEGKAYTIGITTYEDGTGGNIIKSVVGYDGTDINEALLYEPSTDVAADDYDAAKIQAMDNIILSLFPTSTDEVAEVVSYAKYLIQTNADIKKIDTVIKWLCSAYDDLDINDKSPLFSLSKDLLDLRSKTATDLYTFNAKMDYKGMSASLRAYLGLKPLSTDEKNYKSDLNVMLPLALKKFAPEINNRFKQGVPVGELITEEESKMFTPIWASMVNDLYNDVNSGVKMDDAAKVTARFLAVKDLSVLLKASSASYSSSYIPVYVEAKYMMDETAVKAKENGIMDDNTTGSYNKDLELNDRAIRLESGAKYY